MKPILIWDGDCGFCQASVRWLSNRPRWVDNFTEAPRQRVQLPHFTDQMKERAGREVVLLFPDGRTLGGADAVFHILAKTGWGFFATLLGLPPFIYLMRIGYRVVANRRGKISQRWFGGEACAIPQAQPSDDAPPSKLA